MPSTCLNVSAEPAQHIGAHVLSAIVNPMYAITTENLFIVMMCWGKEGQLCIQ